MPKYLHQHMSRKWVGERVYCDFGITDARGRAIGYGWIIGRMETLLLERPNPEMVFSYYDFPDTTPFFAKTAATRNGEKFGALTREIRNPDLNALMIDLQKKIDGARKRYVKQFGKAQEIA